MKNSSSGTDDLGKEDVSYRRLHIALIVLSLLSFSFYLISTLPDDLLPYGRAIDITSGLLASLSFLAGSILVVYSVHRTLGLYTLLLLFAGVLAVLSEVFATVRVLIADSGDAYPAILSHLDKWMLIVTWAILLFIINLVLFEVGVHKSRLLNEAKRRLKEVTERKKLEEQLRQAQKMEAIGNLAGGVAHDFNNLLQVILGYTEMVKLGLGPEHKYWSKLEASEQSALKAKALTQQLLAFSRRQVLQPTTLNLNDIIVDSMRMLRRLIPENIAIEFTPEPKLGSAHVDAGQLAQVLMNLAINARDAMPKGGSMSIQTANAVIDEHYCKLHPWAKPGRYVLFSVSDTGCGMDEATQNQIFDPFFTTKGLGQGTGLGLSTVYGIVKQHKGLISVYSEPGMGTIFKAYFPSVEQSSKTLARGDVEPVKGGTETILLAEDDEGVRGVACQILTEAGYTVLAVENGIEAVNLFQANTQRIDLAVLDMIMPKQGGWETYEIINAANTGVRFLFCSGYTADSVHTDFVLREGIHLAEKPYSRDTLLSKVREVLDS